MNKTRLRFFVALGLLCGILTQRALAVDHNNVDAGRPLSFDDAEAIAYRERAVEAGLTGSFPNDGKAGLGLGAEFLYGFALNNQISVDADPSVGGRAGSDETRFDAGDVGTSLVNFAQSIFTGDFDGLLLKPINTRFLVTFGGIDTNQISRLVGGLSLLIWWIVIHHVSLLVLLAFVTEFVMVLFSIYSLFFLIASSSIFFVQMQNFGDLMNNILNIGRLPVEIFNGGLRIIFFYIIPVAFIATFPARMLLGRGSATDIVILFIITLTTFFLSQLVWNSALKRYSSASS
jgi:ABC-2 type transport system permease protein